VVEDLSIERGRIVGEQLIRLQGEIDKLQLDFARLASDFSTTGYYEDEGYTTPINWIRVNCHLNAGMAADRVAVGDCLDQIPESVQAMERGEVGFAHLVVMARTALAVGKEFRESDLIDRAKRTTPGKFHHHCDHYRHAKDPVRFAKDQAEIAEQRKLELTTWQNGVLSLKGYLDPVGGAALRSALESLLPKKSSLHPEDRKHRLADALVELASLNARTSLQVTASVETLMGLAGTPAGETEFSLPISSATVERMACDCSVTRVLLNGESLVIDVGRSMRVISGSRRRALNARDGGCRWPGCDHPVKWTQGHHLIHWTKGGSTSIDNQLLLCFRHHVMVHEGGWQLVMSDDGRILPVRPPERFAFARGPD
jgi:hypothetical protein